LNVSVDIPHGEFRPVVLFVSKTLVALVVEHSNHVLLAFRVAGDASDREDVWLGNVCRLGVGPTNVVEDLGAFF
jgi:hypothetical protein